MKRKKKVNPFFVLSMVLLAAIVVVLFINGEKKSDLERFCDDIGSANPTILQSDEASGLFLLECSSKEKTAGFIVVNLTER